MHRAAHPTTTRRRVLARVVPSVLGIGLAVVLTGCGAGQITQTDTQRSGVNGATGGVGPIALRDVQLAAPANQQGVYAPGANAVLVATIVNTGLTGDSLIKVTTPAATAVLIDGSPSGTAPLPGNFAIASGQDPDDATGIGSDTQSPPSSTSTSPSVSASASSTPSSSQVPSQAQLAPGRVTIEINGIRSVNGASLRSGMTIPITFYFARAGQVTIQNVPIGAPADSTAVVNPSN